MRRSAEPGIKGISSAGHRGATQQDSGAQCAAHPTRPHPSLRLFVGDIHPTGARINYRWMQLPWQELLSSMCGGNGCQAQLHASRLGHLVCRGLGQSLLHITSHMIRFSKVMINFVDICMHIYIHECTVYISITKTPDWYARASCKRLLAMECRCLYISRILRCSWCP